jgi:tetratricopeptide (TPR) repeat protein
MAAKLDPDRAIFHYELAKTLIESDAFDEAEAELEQVIRVKPRHADAWGLRAGIAASRGDAELSLDCLALAEKLRHSNLDRLVEQRWFDPIRHDPRFAEAMRERRVPGLERESAS